MSQRRRIVALVLQELGDAAVDQRLPAGIAEYFKLIQRSPIDCDGVVVAA
jgi:hypothetical protein